VCRYYCDNAKDSPSDKFFEKILKICSVCKVAKKELEKQNLAALKESTKNIKK